MPAITLDPSLAPSLADARHQAHHAAQFATAAGISYLPPQADDSHTNLEWMASLGALTSHVVPAATPFRLALRMSDLTILLLDASAAVRWSFSLHGQTIDDAATWIRARLSDLGVDGREYTLTRHYVIPPHPVADGAAFDASDRARLEQLSRWFACASEVLESLRTSTHGASEVRCWPHHFDIATLIDLGPGRTIGVGLEPGDVYYDEPYFYVNMRPQPRVAPTATLDGNGTWHTREWIGAVLRGSRLTAGDGQRAQIDGFIRSALTAARSLIGLESPGHE
jgi:hypothetical protein